MAEHGCAALPQCGMGATLRYAIKLTTSPSDMSSVMSRRSISLLAYRVSRNSSLRHSKLFFGHRSALLDHQTERPPVESQNAMTEPLWHTPYLQGKVAEGQETLLYHTTFAVYLRGLRVKYQPEEFLQACWSTGFDTPCSTCTEEFDIAVAPPVRLLELEQRVSQSQTVDDNTSASNHHKSSFNVSEVQAY